MFKKIPPQILYPGIVVSILGLSIVANIVLIIKASNDQGPQIIDNYYDTAAHYNDVIAQREESARLGWKTKMILRPVEEPKSRQIDFVVLDANDAPLTGAVGRVELFNPAKTEIAGTGELSQVNDGLYTVKVEGEELKRHGLYDVVLYLDHDGSHYKETVRKRL